MAAAPASRACPHLMYSQNVPPFTEHYRDDEGDDSIDQGPAGGRTWDGRAQSAHDQARLPLFSPSRWPMRTRAPWWTKVRHAGYAAQLQGAFGANIFDDKTMAFKGVLVALEAYQQSPSRVLSLQPASTMPGCGTQAALSPRGTARIGGVQ